MHIIQTPLQVLEHLFELQLMAITDYAKLEAFAQEHTGHAPEEWAMDAYGELMQGFEQHGAQEQGSITIRALRLQTGRRGVFEVMSL